MGIRNAKKEVLKRLASKTLDARFLEIERILDDAGPKVQYIPRQ